MNKEKMLEQLQTMIIPISDRRVDPTESLMKTKILDSMLIVDFVLDIETAFGIKIKPNEIKEENFDTLELALQFIAKKLDV